MTGINELKFSKQKCFKKISIFQNNPPVCTHDTILYKYRVYLKIINLPNSFTIAESTRVKSQRLAYTYNHSILCYITFNGASGYSDCSEYRPIVCGQ